MTILLDTHVVHWWSAEPERVSKTAAEALSAADELAVADITWWELAWLARHDRIAVAVPIGTWLSQLAVRVRSVPMTPAIATTAASLPDRFPKDPADRLIYATAVEHGWRLVTKDVSMRKHRYPRPITLW